MNLSSSMRAAVAITEAVHGQWSWFPNQPNYNFEVKSESVPIYMNLRGREYRRQWRTIKVIVHRNGNVETTLDITLYGNRHDHSWFEADITLHVQGNTHLDFRFKARWTPQGWTVREVFFVASSQHFGEAMTFNYPRMIPISREKKVTTP